MDLQIYAPLQSLFDNHKIEKTKITAALELFHSSKLLDYLPSRFALSTKDFEPVKVISMLDAKYWQQAMMLTDVRATMPAKDRNAWDDSIREGKTPPFEPESVRATLQTLIARKGYFLGEKVFGLFNSLSDTHLTNQPEGFSKRMIINYLHNSDNWSTNYRQCGFLDDFRNVIQGILGNPTSNLHNTSEIVLTVMQGGLTGKMITYDGGAFRMAIFKKGTAHLDIHPDIAYKLNSILASHAPNMLFNKGGKVKKPAPTKEWGLLNRALNDDTIVLLKSGVGDGNRFVIRNGYQKIVLSGEFLDVMALIGGTRTKDYEWSFEYNPKDIISELILTRTIPDHKSHQYYPTPESLSETIKRMIRGDALSILEPSAGTGNLIIHNLEDITTAIEINPLFCDVLKLKGVGTVINTDFLKWESEQKFDVVIMNPPFSEGRALLHLKKAYKHLADGGQLLAILPANMKDKAIFGNERWSEVYQNEFELTNVNVVILEV